MDFLNAIVALANYVIVPATAYGAQLALGALGVTLIYGILRFSNFAHGDTMAFGTMVTILFTWWLPGLGHRPRPAADRAAGAALRHRRHGAVCCWAPTARSIASTAAEGGAGDPGDRLDGRDVHHERARRASSSAPATRTSPTARASSSPRGQFKEMTGLHEGLAICIHPGDHRGRPRSSWWRCCSGSSTAPAPASRCARFPTTRIWRCCRASTPSGW